MINLCCFEKNEIRFFLRAGAIAPKGKHVFHITLGIKEVFLEHSVRKIWVRGEPSPEPHIPCYLSRRPKGGERSVARSVAE